MITFKRRDLMEDFNKENKITNGNHHYVWENRHPDYNPKIFEHLMGRVAFYGEDIIRFRVVQRDSATVNRLGNSPRVWAVLALYIGANTFTPLPTEFKTKKSAIEWVNSRY